MCPHCKMDDHGPDESVSQPNVGCGPERGDHALGHVSFKKWCKGTLLKCAGTIYDHSFYLAVVLYPPI